MNFENIVPYIPVSNDRKIELENILRVGNNLLKKYHEQVKSAREISRYSRTVFLNDIYSNYCAEKDMFISNVKIPSNDVEKIVLVKKVEEEVICAYANLINKLSRGWLREGLDITLSCEDLKSEAYQATLDAIAHFTEEVRFSTFLHHCIQRHMYRVCRSSNGLSNFSDGTIKLKYEYSTLSSEEGATFDSVVQKMKIEDKEVKILQTVLAGIQNMTTLDKEEKNQISIVDDNNEEPEVENNIMDVVENLEWSPLERAVLNGVLNSPNTKLGIGSISKNLINPETNKPYSRMAFSLAWKRIKKKISDAYGKAA